MILVGGNKSDPSFFTDKANALSDDLSSGSGYYGNVKIIQVRNFTDFNGALSGNSDIDLVTYMGHSGTSKLYLSSSSMSQADVARLDFSNLTSTARIQLVSCNACSPSGSGANIAQIFAKSSGATTYGYSHGLSFGIPKTPFFSNYRRKGGSLSVARFTSY